MSGSVIISVRSSVRDYNLKLGGCLAALFGIILSLCVSVDRGALFRNHQVLFRDEMVCEPRGSAVRTSGALHAVTAGLSYPLMVNKYHRGLDACLTTMGLMQQQSLKFLLYFLLIFC